jgi:hypothetical protein
MAGSRAHRATLAAMSKRRLSFVIWLAIAIAPGHALAQRSPARTDFENAVLDLAASEVPGDACDGGDPPPPRTLTRSQRVGFIGRVVALGDGRAAAMVRMASGSADANGELAYRFALVVLVAGNGGWSASSVTPIEVAEASFTYEQPIILVARMDDVDDDGEAELFVVMSTSRELECGTGYCTVRRTVVIDVADGSAPVTANIAGAVTCESDGADERSATVQLRDTNRDRHRDLVLRVRECPGIRENDAGELERPPCEPAADTVYVWQEATDRYVSP